MNRRLLGVLVLVAFTLLAAVTAGAYAGRQATTTTLTMWSYDNQDPGLEPVLKQLSKDFEKSHPGVKINLVFKDFNSLVGTVPRALASGSGPDVTEGNQGYQTDAQLVKAKLILPLTKYVKKYGWDKLYAPSTWGMFRWTPDGKSFGKGPVWGIAQTGQNVVAFYNKKKLRQLGFNPNKMPRTFAGFDKLLAPAAREAPRRRAGDPGGQQGGIRLHPPLRRHLGRICQAADRPELDLPRARLALRHPGDDQGAREAPAVGQGGLLQRRLQRVSGTTPPPAEFAKGKGVFWIGRRLGLDDHQDRPRRRERRRDADPTRAEWPVGVDRRPLRPVAHLGEDEVSRPRGRVAQLRDHLAAREGADVLAAADPVRPARQGARG